jgi:hypothetical protein
MDVKHKQQKAANKTVAILALVAVVIYVGFYFLVSNAN